MRARECTSRALLADVAGKWAVLALLALREDGYRFNALRRRMQGVSEKMLAQTLERRSNATGWWTARS